MEDGTAKQPSPPAAEDPSRRLLLVCTHYASPRHTGGIRWRAMTRDLTRLGWAFDVIAIDPSDPREPAPMDPIDPTPGVTLHLLPLHWWGQEARLRGRAAIRGLLGRGDMQAGPGSHEAPAEAAQATSIGPAPALTSRLNGSLELLRDDDWAKHAARLTGRLLARHAHAGVIVSSPVHTAHRAGLLAARRGLPYIADFRDPLYYGRGEDLRSLDPLTRRAWRRLEDGIVRAAAHTVGISEVANEAVMRDLRDRGPRGVNPPPMRFIPNGYDPFDAPPAPPDPDVFRIAYIGWFYEFCDIEAIFSACGRLARRRGLAPGRLRLQFVGTPEAIRGEPLSKLASRHGIANCFERHRRQSFARADELMQRAAVLIAYDSVVSGGLCIPTKLYFYARTRGDLLLLGRPDGALARESAKIGQRVFEPADRAGIDARLDAAFDRWQRGAYDEPLDTDGLFDSARSSEQMHDLLIETLRG